MIVLINDFVREYAKEEKGEALHVIPYDIYQPGKMQPKFAQSNAQHLLRKNRIKALGIA